MKLKDKIELLKKMEMNTYNVAKIFEESGDKEFAKQQFHQACAIGQAITILTNDKFANEIAMVFAKEEK